jgi:hypothetical protein
MSTALKKSLLRAPRYTLRSFDNRVLRFSKSRRTSQAITTELINVSETGMAFWVDLHQAPSIGEMIKVEFRVPAERYQVAWYARVIWVDSPLTSTQRKRTQVRVGVRFYELPDGHRKILETGLTSRFRYLQGEKRKQAILQKFKILCQAIAYLMLIAAAGYFIYFITRESPGYNSSHPSGWGERFFKKVIKEPHRGPRSGD